MWEAPEAPHEEGQIAWYGLPATGQFKSEWEKGKCPGFYVWDIAEEAIFHHERREYSGQADRIDRVLRAGDPETAKQYWYVVAEHRHMVHDPGDLARWDAYVEAHQPPVTAAAKQAKAKSAGSRVVAYALIILFIILGLLYNMTSCSFHDPLSRIM